MLGDSPQIKQVQSLVARVASTDAAVMILGESGTGKELVARSLHRQSDRRNHEFVAVNMAALPSTLVESMLFGHERGSFTGANAKQPGLCEVAERGTLFLDEIGEMEYDAQSKILRFLEDLSYRRIGSSKTRTANLRVVSATNRDPEELLGGGAFREDLYYRLNVVPIVMPPLRERREDIPVLIEEFRNNANARYGKGVETIEAAAMDALCGYEWPGNVRELKNTVERLVIFSEGSVVAHANLPGDILECPPSQDIARTVAPPSHPSTDGEFLTMDEREQQALIDALTRTEWNVVNAAKLLEIGHATAYRRIKRHGIALQRSQKDCK